MLRIAAVAALSLLVVVPLEALAEGKYARRQRLRGESTDTAPKLDRWSFINDAAPDPARLVLAVDAWGARRPHHPRLLPLAVALSYEGDGSPIPIRPDRFELWWEGAAAPVRALDHQQMIAAADGPNPFYHDVRKFEVRAPLSFDTPRARRIGIQFYTHPSLSGFRHDRLMLPARSWVATLMYFEVPEGFAAWESLFEVRYVPEDGAPPAVACRFRIERDPGLQQSAMRRAKKDLRRESEKPR